MHNGHPLTATQASELALRMNAMTVGFSVLGFGPTLNIGYAIPAADPIMDGVSGASWPHVQSSTPRQRRAEAKRALFAPVSDPTMPAGYGYLVR